MPFKDPDPTDPNMLVGVVLPADAEATRDMAYVFAEEFARMGYTREQLLWLFKNPFYGGAHGAYRSLGESETLSIIDECLNAWGQAKFSILDFGFSIDEGNRQDSESDVDSEQDRRQAEPLNKDSCVLKRIRTIQNPKSKIRNGGEESDDG
jgi:hypothetical protein